jgi:small-conductance mechanosensitive channel
MTLQSEPVAVDFEAVLREFVDGIVTALPRIALGVLFLVLAYLVIRIVLAVVRGVLQAAYRAQNDLIVDLWVTIVGVFLWFGAVLALFNIVGLGEVAASLGTASGFIGLGIAFALKEMIADTVAGVHLPKDPDFNVGDVVETAGETGEVVEVGLRQTRLRNSEGDLVVVSNAAVEKRWRQDAVGPESAKSDHSKPDDEDRYPAG